MIVALTPDAATRTRGAAAARSGAALRACDAIQHRLWRSKRLSACKPAQTHTQPRSDSAATHVDARRGALSVIVAMARVHAAVLPCAEVP